MVTSRIFEWADANDAANYGKHGIRFAEAAWVLEDRLPYRC